MNWQNNDFLEDENDSKVSLSDHSSHSVAIQTQNEQKTVAQLEHLKNLKNDDQIRKYISSMSTFGHLLLQNSQIEIAIDLLTDDCEAFLFNFAEGTEVRFGFKHEGFVSVFQDIKVLQRDVKETFVDKEKQTTFQICYYRFYNKKDESIVAQFSFEIFSFQEYKIRKYRASFGTSPSFTEFENPLIPSRKDIMLAKVRELSLAWANQPDLERIAALMHESTEYKLWSWEDMKGFNLDKRNFVTEFKNIETNYILKRVVPYEVFSEGQFIMANYVYHLEGKHNLSGEKFLWLSTCIFTFDKNLNFAKINQQGELYREDEILIPFNESSREKMMKLIQGITDFKEAVNLESEIGILNNDTMQFSYEMSRFGPSAGPFTGTIKGFSEYDRLMQVFRDKKRYFEFSQMVEDYIDCYNPSYDTAILLDCTQGSVERGNYQHSGKTMNYYSIRKLCFENGKLAKLMIFFSDIPEEIPSPYDNETFSAMNIKSKKDFIKRGLV